MTAAELLEETNQAILACLKAQAYGSGPKSLQRARLAELRELRAELQREVALESAGGNMCSLGMQVDA